ncbi:HEPN domain-containing protein [Paenibacillus ferrarius]|uniref:HEPN domain-containing protein n=1 Tax=Paenibacillus ferrarius TaxID=1469647 RepID=UPI003D27F7C2
MRSETQHWIDKAEGDLRSSLLLFHGSEWDNTCYHAQQSAEKALKAVLCELGADISKTHNLERLAITLGDLNVTLPQYLLEGLTDLNGLDTLVRYPGYDATHDDATKALANVQLVLAFVREYFTPPSPDSIQI